MSKKIVPQVSDLIDDAIIMTADGMKGKAIPIKPQELQIYLNMLLAVDKNNRDIKAAFAKDLDDWDDEKLKAELEKP